MNGSNRLAPFLAWTMVLLSLPFAGCNRQDADRLAKLGTKLEKKAETLGGKSNGGLIRGWQTVPLHLGDVAVDARVLARLNWDKSLADTAIQVQLADGVVELHGQVRDAQQKHRAVELAESTLGVEKVTDRLEIGPDSAASPKR